MSQNAESDSVTMGDAQRRFRIPGARRPGEDEPPVACPVGRRHNDLAGLRRNRHPSDAGYRLRGGQAIDSVVNAAPWNRDHHDSRGGALPFIAHRRAARHAKVRFNDCALSRNRAIR